MKVKDKEKLNSPMKGRQILNASSLMGFHTVECKASAIYQKNNSQGCSSEELPEATGS